MAKKINDASHDQLKDSWWDKHVRKWIHDHADLLKVIADVLTWIVTIVIVCILVFATGGLLLAVILTAGALLIHSALALNGDGSWVDVAVDAFALLTMGGGKLLAEGARGAYAARMGLQGFADATAEARMAFTQADGFVAKATVWLTRSNPVFRTVEGYGAGLARFSEAMSTEFEGGRLIDLLTMGDKEAAGLYKAVNQAIDNLGPGLMLNSSKFMLNVVRPVFVSGVTVDASVKIINPAFPRFWSDGSPIKPAITGISDWVEEHTVRHGGYW